METIEERVLALEKRMNILEMMSYNAQTNQSSSAQQKQTDRATAMQNEENQMNQPNNAQSNNTQSNNTQPNNTQSSNTQSKLPDMLSSLRNKEVSVQQTINNIPKNTNSKIDEAVFGKYIIGALASLLIFVAAISLIALVWDRLSSETKLSLIVLVGFILTSIGFIRVKKHKNPITSIILGTGSGLLFISILAANMAFALITSTTAFLLAGIWALFFIISYKYTQTFFTTVIAYIGSFIAIILGLTLVESSIDYIVVIIFTISIGAAILVTGYKWLNDTKQLICTLLTLINVSCVLIVGLLYNINILTNWVYYFAVLMLLLHGLTNRVFYLFDKLKLIIWHLFIGAFVALLTMIGLCGLLDIMDYSQILFVFILIILAQLVFSEWRNYTITTSLTVLYTTFLTGAIILLNIELFDFPLGITVVTFILLLLDKLKNKSRYKVLTGFIVLFDTILVLLFSSVSQTDNILAYSIYITINLGVITYILSNQYRLNSTDHSIMLKIIGFISFIVNIFFLVARLVSNFNKADDGINGGVIGYLFITILLIIFINSGYFKDWNSPNFKWFSKNRDVLQDKSISVLYVGTSIIYFLGLIGINEVTAWYEQTIMIVTVLSIALLQSVNLLRYYKAVKVVGIWIGIKYWILTWIVLGVTFDMPFDSVIYSLAGLILSLLSIAIGFKVNVKTLRLYGLILTILMVLKFIIVDLSQENSITRVIALMLGGLICFGISVLYNKLNTIIDEKNLNTVDSDNPNLIKS